MTDYTDITANVVHGVQVDNVVYDFVDVLARQELSKKITAPTVGVSGQVLSKTTDGVTWISIPKPTTYSGSTTISIDSNNVLSITDTVALKEDLITYSEGEGINITDNTISVDFNEVAKKSDVVTYKEGVGIDIATDGTISCTISEGQPYYDGNGIDITSDNKINIKGVPYFDYEPEDVVGLYMNSEGLKFAGASELVTTTIMSQELSHYITEETFSNTIGNLNNILDAINREVK